jgi:hypothetical protein
MEVRRVHGKRDCDDRDQPDSNVGAGTYANNPTGNTSGICPECGTPIDQDAKPGAA